MRYPLIALLLISSFSFAWLDGWGYRTPINISNSGSVLADYQVQISPYIYNNTGLIGSWHFSEGSGSLVADSSGSGNAGTITIAAGGSQTTLAQAWSNGASGKFGRALSFDGTDDYVELSNPTTFDVFSSGASGRLFTFEAWIKFNSVPTGSDYVTFFSAYSSAYPAVFRYTNGQFVLWIYSGGWRTPVTATFTPQAGAWYHLAYVKNSSSEWGIYINGTNYAVGTNPYTSSVPSNIYVGTYAPGAGSGEFNGTIDEVRIYNRSLSAQEVQEHYNATKARLDYADLRFALANDTQIPYWLESDKSVWVKVPSIPLGNSTIYMYYGSPSAASAGNFDDTFTKDSVLDGLVVGYHMDEGAGVKAYDFSGYGRNGTMPAANWYGSDGGQWAGVDRQFASGNALNRSYATMGDLDLITGNKMTVAAWMKANETIPEWYSLASKSYNEISWGLQGDNNPNRIRFWVGVGASPYQSAKAVSNNALNDGKWHFVAGVYDGTLGSGNIMLYVDGIKQAVTYTGTGNVASTSDWETIGAGTRFDGVTGGVFPGVIDEVRIYNRALSTKEITALYERRKYASSEPIVSSSVEQQVDVTPPVVSISSPNASVIYSSLSVPLNFTASDASDISSCKYELNGINTTLADCLNATMTAQSGSNSLVVWAYDGSNWGSASVSFEVSLVQPPSGVSNSTTTNSLGIGNVSLSGIPSGASSIVYSVGSSSFSKSFSVSSGVSSVRISSRVTLQGNPVPGRTLAFAVS